MQDFINRTNKSIDPLLSAPAAPASPLDLETRRLALIGRITANIVHEMSNPMQAICGGTTLAMEEVDNPAAVLEYLRLIQQGSERTLALINLIHSLYAPGQSAPKTLDLEKFILSLKPIVKDDLNHKGLMLHIIHPEKTIFVWVIESSLQLALLNLLLTFNQNLTALQCKDYSAIFYQEESTACVEFSLPIKLNLDPDGQNRCDITFSEEYLQKIKGNLCIQTTDEHTLVRVNLPLALPNEETSGE
jgi:hypothetical protein